MHSDGRIQMSGKSLNKSFSEKVSIFTSRMKTSARTAFEVLSGRIDLN